MSVSGPGASPRCPLTVVPLVWLPSGPVLGSSRVVLHVDEQSHPAESGRSRRGRMGGRMGGRMAVCPLNLEGRRGERVQVTPPKSLLLSARD